MSNERPTSARRRLDIHLRQLALFLRKFRHNRLAMFGSLLLVGFAFVGIFGPMLAPYDPTKINPANGLAPPSAVHPFGTDQLGRDIFSRVLTATRISLTVAVAVPLFAMIVGVPIGLVAGYARSAIDNALMRLVDAMFAFPAIVLGLTLVAVFGQGLRNVIVAIGIVYIPQFARITRGSAISTASEAHVTAAKIEGASHLRVIAIHIFPFCVSAILVQGTITAASAILIEAALSFLGVGVPAPQPTWGRMLDNSLSHMETAWWFATFPGLAILTAVMGINLLGDGLRDVLDPRVSTQR